MAKNIKHNSSKLDKWKHTSRFEEMVGADKLTKKLDDKEIQDKEFWEAYNDPKKMIEYVSKYGDTEIKNPYIKEIEKFAIENSSEKVPGFPLKGYTKEFKNDDPTTYLSNKDQQKNMLLDTIDAKQKKLEKKVATMGDRKSDGLWKKFVDQNADMKLVAKKPTPIQPTLPGADWDWRLAPWWEYPSDDDAPPATPKEEARITFKEFLKRTKTKPDPDLDKGLGYLLGVKGGK